MSGKTARKAATGALAAGGAAAAGALAWKFYQKWSRNTQISETPRTTPSQTPPEDWPTALSSSPTEAAPPSDPSPEQAALPQASATGLALLEAMVFAARADGHIDERERANIHAAVQTMFPGQDAAALVDELMDKPLDPASLAARVPDYEQGCDLYRLSCTIIDVDDFRERSYLDTLATAFRKTNSAWSRKPRRPDSRTVRGSLLRSLSPALYKRLPLRESPNGSLSAYRCGICDSDATQKPKKYFTAFSQ